ncbi:hypothetical protein Rt10032_c10g4153 [Rhodotorula toruloides]|uniref:Uncharacterized protein n=1 Tax=Rhodotorula toruloides TaxID=5286 RepID=A0A511KJV0_RHOTO|nr:hypothetical protein Rt10032_c10g4153 [Rhodotorula toruloides]
MDSFDSNGIPKLVLRKKPDGDFFRNHHQLGCAVGLPYFDDGLLAHLLDVLETVRWMYDDEKMDIEAVHYLLKYAPLPLQYLIRGFAYAISLREGVVAAKATLTSHLQSRVLLSRHQSAAVVLLDWLKGPRTPHRRSVLFTRSDGSPRFEADGQEPWAWFFDKVARGYPYDAGVLDTWEQTRLAEEDWDIACV